MKKSAQKLLSILLSVLLLAGFLPTVLSSQQANALVFPGDVNNNGSVDAADARLALRIAVGVDDFSYAADVDGDNSVTSRDARLILRESVGYDAIFGECAFGFGYPSVVFVEDRQSGYDEDSMMLDVYLLNAQGLEYVGMDVSFNPSVLRFDTDACFLKNYTWFDLNNSTGRMSLSFDDLYVDSNYYWLGYFRVDILDNSGDYTYINVDINGWRGPQIYSDFSYIVIGTERFLAPAVYMFPETIAADEVAVHLYASNCGGLTSGDLRLWYNQNVMQFYTSNQPGTLSDSYCGYNNTAGLLDYSFYFREMLGEGGEDTDSFYLGTFYFTVSGDLDDANVSLYGRTYGVNAFCNDYVEFEGETPLEIVQQPESLSGPVGTKHVFSVFAVGDGVSYQWQKYINGSWNNLSGYTKSAFSITLANAHNGVKYRCKVTDARGNVVYSNAASVTVVSAKITEQPQSVSQTIGAGATFSVTVSGTDPTYQWQKSTDGGSSWANLSGYTKRSFSIKLQAGHNGVKYRCVIKCGGKTLYSDAATVTVLPAITEHPKSVSGVEGQGATFSVTATGVGLTYQWQKYINGSWNNLSGYTKRSFSIKLEQRHNGVKYRCVVKDANGKSLTSGAATVAVYAPVKITASPQSVSMAEGQNVTFSVAATGAGLTYQWQKVVNGSWTNLSGYTKNTISFKMTAKHNGMKYRCVVKDSAGNTATSAAATVTLSVGVKITAHPQSVTGSVGTAATFSVTAEGTGLTYQWQKYINGGWSDLSGYTKRSFSIKMETRHNGVKYRCVVKDSSGNKATSNAASVTVRTSVPAFAWGKDNWSFINSDYTGDFSSGTYRSQISSSYISTLKSKLKPSEYYTVFGDSYTSGAIDEYWGGSCYGMSVLTILSKNGLVPYGSYTSGATNLHGLQRPTKNMNVSSLITYYHMIQYADGIQQQYRTVPTRSHSTNIKDILSQLEKYGIVLVCFVQDSFGGHAIVAYGVEYGAYTFNGVSYQGCIKICDPNAATAYDERYNIYFNTSTYSWLIPAYSSSGITSSAGARFFLVSGDLSLLNYGGYLSGTSGSGTASFIARIDAKSINDSHSVAKLKQAGDGTYTTMSAGPNDIVQDYSYVFGAGNEKTFGYNLRDASAPYRVTQKTPVELKLNMDYKNCDLSARSAAGTCAEFDPSGYVKVEGESADFALGMTFDSDYPTDWFHVDVAGSGANTASLQKTADGYVLTADVLNNVTVHANNRTASAVATFSTSEPSVLIYEVSSSEVGLKADKNHDGVYETVLQVSPVSIVKHPSAVNAAAGEKATFSVTAVGSNLTYQWQKSTDGGKTWANLSGYTASSFTITLAAAHNGVQYRCKVSDGSKTVYSNAAKVTVTGAPQITGQPTSVTGAVGTKHTFKVTATGSNLTYQWQKSTDGGKTWANLSGYTASSFAITLASAHNGVQYRCAVKSGSSTVYSNAAKVTVTTAPQITGQPASVKGAVGTQHTFKVTATGSNLTYQWQKSTDSGKTWVNLSGYTNNAFTIKLTAAHNGVQYRCAVKSGSSTVYSNAAKVTVSLLQITGHPASVSAAAGTKHTFRVTAEGSNLTYQWQKSTDGGKTWVNLSGYTSDGFTITLNSNHNGVRYRCRVSDGIVNAYTNAATVTVK